MRFFTAHSTSSLALFVCSADLTNGFSLVSPTATASPLTKENSRISLQQFMVPPSTTEEDTKGGVFSAEVQQEAKEALQSVGWARPLDDGEMTSEDPFVQQIDAGIQRDFGVGLDDLLNPAKVVNLERELYNLRAELATITNKKDEETGQIVEVAGLSTNECDGGGGGEEADAIRAKISKKETDLAIERRSVFRDWLKNIFVGQAVISFGISYIMATNPKALFGGFDWFYSYNMDISIQVLGYWFWWLFIVPSLRSRRPKGAEKQALDIAFLGTPLISILAPVATKDTGLIWLANFAVVAGAYGFAFWTDGDDDNSNSDNSDSNQPAWLKFVYKSLDFGSGRERGARK
ncbi:hypothetical protein IV203_038629 [Nitzschia inconspicua]|uniref:Uncharacterized protein n=1 Tax=Nitzschia inconspicua TaxID=303405 RepID=A0A9K3Q007_9STRA|nr:hypothetical protein IV203_038629 [Nitzschia inconspicua]